MVNLEVDFCGLTLKNPILAGSSGLTGTSKNIENAIRAGVGGVVGKTISTIPGLYRPHPYAFSLIKNGFHDGEMIVIEGVDLTPPKIWAQKQGSKFIKICHDAKVPFIGSIMGHGENVDDWVKLAKIVEGIGVDAIEINYSCEISRIKSNSGPLAIDPKLSYEVTRAVKDSISVPVISKLFPFRGAPKIAKRCVQAGADGLTAFNAIGLMGLFIDVEKEEIFGLPTAGFYSPGRAIKPITLSLIADVLQEVKLPVSGIGGIWNWKDALEFLMLGCSNVQLVTSAYKNGYKVFSDIVKGVADFMTRKGYHDIGDFQGKALRSVIPLKKLLTRKEWDIVRPMWPVVNQAKCNLCGICQDACIYGAIKVNKTPKSKGVAITKGPCQSCGMCVSICPCQAIRMVDTEGKVVWAGEGTVKLDLLKSM